MDKEKTIWNFNKLLLENTSEGYAYHKIILDKSGNPCDYKFLEINRAFEILTDLNASEIIGKNATEIFPEIKNGSFDWIGVYGKVALTGEKLELENFSEVLGKWYKVTAYSPEKHYFVTLFSDITGEKETLKMAEKLLQTSFLKNDYKKLSDTALTISGAKYVALNIYEEDGNFFRTVAISGNNNHVDKAISILSFNPKNKKWPHDTDRANKIAGQKTTEFSNLRKLTRGVIPDKIVRILEKTFNFGEVYVVKIERDNQMIGDFTIIMNKGHVLKNKIFLEIYSSLVGLSITRLDLEYKLSETQVNYQHLVESSMVGILTCDINGNIKYLNPRVLNILGSPGEKETKNINLLKFEPLIKSGFPNYLAKVLSTGKKTGPLEIAYKTRWNKEVIVRVHIAPIYSQNELSGAQILIDEITDRVELEDLRKKEILLQEIHHRVKNNLQVIASLLNMQARNFEDESVKSAFLDSQSRIKSMSLAHEKIYGVQDLSRIEISDYIRNLENYILRTYFSDSRNIDLRNDLDTIYLDIERTVPLGLILTELITNSIKHAFPDKDEGLISVTFKSLNGEYILKVSDNGIGIPEDYEINNPKSIGLKVVTMLTRQLDANLEIDTSNGTSYSIIFKDELIDC